MRYGVERTGWTGVMVCMVALACGGSSSNETPSGDTGTVATPAAPDSSATANPAQPGSGQAGTPAPADSGRDQSVVYTCNDRYRFAARVGQDSVWLTLPTREITLPHVQAASGARYSNGTVTFWNKGNSARLEVPPDTFPDCAGQPAANIWESARLRGIDFRAVGNEPGWYLEIDDGQRIVAVVDYGEKRVVTPAPPPAMTDADTRRISYLVQAEAHRLSIVIAELPCADVMSGEEFPARVTLTLDGKEYQGCGRALR